VWTFRRVAFISVGFCLIGPLGLGHPQCRPLYLHARPVGSATVRLSDRFCATILPIDGRLAAKISGVIRLLLRSIQSLRSEQ